LTRLDDAPILPPAVRALFAFARLAGALTLALASVAAMAAPEEPGSDALQQFLEDRGLLPLDFLRADPPPLVRQVRDAASDLAIAALNFIGVPYRRGGESADEGFDCSGFTRHIFEHTLGLALPRRADDQASAPGIMKIARDELRPGDLVFFNTLRRTFSHVGIYLGDGKFIHSPRSGSEVRVEDMRSTYWASRFTGARRAQALDGGSSEPAARLR
jgi:cell wall-associated NlpC family hydrolase